MTAELPAALVDALRSASRSGEIAIAYSGGLDSRFLAFSAKKTGLTPLLYHVTGPHVAPAESESALSHAREMGFPVTVVPFDPSVLDLARAGRARCYVCKKALFSAVLAKLREDRPSRSIGPVAAPSKSSAFSRPWPRPASRRPTSAASARQSAFPPPIRRRAPAF